MAALCVAVAGLPDEEGVASVGGPEQQEGCCLLCLMDAVAIVGGGGKRGLLGLWWQSCWLPALTVSTAPDCRPFTLCCSSICHSST